MRTCHRLVHILSIPELRLVGTPYERGYQHGSALSGGIARLYSAWVRCGARQARPIGEAELLEFARCHWAPASAFAPHWIDEVRGIADGAGLDVLQVFLLNCWDELCSWLSVRGGTTAVGCTSFAVRSPRTKRISIGQNQDAFGWWKPVVILNERSTGGEIATLCTAHPGVLGTTGLNERGVALVANSLIPEDRGFGAPFTFVMREALRQKSLEGAVQSVSDSDRSTGANYVLASTDGAFDLETSRSQVSLQSLEQVLTHSNHYMAGTMRALDRGGELLPDTYRRAGRLEILLASGDAADDPMAAVEALADHQGWPTSICRHSIGQEDQMETLGAVVAVPDQLKLYVTDGSPCSRSVLSYSLSLEGDNC